MLSSVYPFIKKCLDRSTETQSGKVPFFMLATPLLFLYEYHYLGNYCASTYPIRGLL